MEDSNKIKATSIDQLLLQNFQQSMETTKATSTDSLSDLTDWLEIEPEPEEKPKPKSEPEQVAKEKPKATPKNKVNITILSAEDKEGWDIEFLCEHVTDKEKSVALSLPEGVNSFVPPIGESLLIRINDGAPKRVLFAGGIIELDNLPTIISFLVDPEA